MADVSFLMAVGSTTASAAITPTNARLLEYLDDLRNIKYGKIDDGSGGQRVMTQQEVADFHTQKRIDHEIYVARRLKKERLGKSADDLDGN